MKKYTFVFEEVMINFNKTLYIYFNLFFNCKGFNSSEGIQCIIAYIFFSFSFFLIFEDLI